MDVIKVMQDYMYPIEGEIHSADDWYNVGVKGTDSEVFQKLVNLLEILKKRSKR